MPPADAGYDVKPHPCIILTEPFRDRLLIVNLTRVLGQSTDYTCVLNVGDHQVINQESFVFYKKAFIIEARKILKGLEENRIENKNILKNGVFQKVCQGIEDSDKTPYKIKKFYQEYLESLNG